MCVLSVNETKKVAREEGRSPEARGAVSPEKRTTKRKQNPTKKSVAHSPSLCFFSAQAKKENSDKAPVPEFEPALPLRDAHVFSSL